MSKITEKEITNRLSALEALEFDKKEFFIAKTDSKGKVLGFDCWLFNEDAESGGSLIKFSCVDYEEAIEYMKETKDNIYGLPSTISKQIWHDVDTDCWEKALLEICLTKWDYVGNDAQQYFNERFYGEAGDTKDMEPVCVIKWCREDIKTALKERGFADHSENIDTVLEGRFERTLQERSTEEGWEIIHDLIFECKDRLEKVAHGNEAVEDEQCSQAQEILGIKCAKKYLERQGYSILEQAWGYKKETIDLIVRDANTIAFVDVATKMNKQNGLPEEAILASKKKKFKAAAIEYLKKVSSSNNIEVRFDVIAILIVGPDRAFLRHHFNAFE